jgi:hypothetical protein
MYVIRRLNRERETYQKIIIIGRMGYAPQASNNDHHWIGHNLG